MNLNIEPTLRQAVSLHQAGRLAEAGEMYRKILAVDPQHIDGLHLLGVVAHQAGRSDLAIELIGKAIALDRRNPHFHANMGEAFRALGRLDEAVTHYERALKLDRSHAAAHSNLGIALMEQGKLTEAIGHYRRAVFLKPDYAEAHMNFGLALLQQGELSEAEAKFEQALLLKPDYPQAQNSFGGLLMRQGKIAEAVARFEQAVQLKPDYAMAYRNLATALFAQGNADYALAAARCAVDFEESPEARVLFVDCVQDLQPTQDIEAVRGLVLRAMSEGWDRPSELARVSAHLIKQVPLVNEGVARAMRAWPQRMSEPELLGPSGLAGLAQDRLLQCMLESAPVCNIELEQFLSAVRFVLLEASAAATAADVVDEPVLGFLCALARQCFINEYVFALTDDEHRKALELRASLAAALGSGAAIPILWPVAVAAYFPLHSLTDARSLPERKWPDSISALLVQQVSEPQEELEIRPTIPRLTAIDDGVSLKVRQQYEENPYPRWVKFASIAKPANINRHMRTDIGPAAYKPLESDKIVEVLIAGCGTGQHPIHSALRYKDAQVLAVDLSLTSLSYARRMTRSLAVGNLEYAQADLLKLGSIGRTFDIIESSGVLHHLADPLEGWRVLLSLLRPRGVMRIGLYSEAARADVKAIRALIAERGYGRSPDEIRRCRQALMAYEGGRLLKDLSRSGDFYSTSGCRDLLFHVQEHRLTIPEIKNFLDENGLTFVGFELNLRLLARFRERFPDDANAVSDLDLWHVFETENPRTFAGMYQFLVQKA